jgi:hypothetical protein
VSAQTRPAGPAAATNVPAPAIAEQADRRLKEVGAYIGSAEQFTFHADITFDHVLPSGQKLQFSAAEEVVLQRPSLDNGMLSVNVVHEVPEAAKPRTIKTGTTVETVQPQSAALALPLRPLPVMPR